ncbi:Uncharacterised protein [Mycobacteroides abscessus]|nr:Uncharacterised protein [Mycobacteroides abscessus]
MIGVATIEPTPSSITPSEPSAILTTRASRATVCCTKMSRGLPIRPAPWARHTTWMAEILSPPKSKNESSTPTRSRPSTWA